MSALSDEVMEQAADLVRCRAAKRSVADAEVELLRRLAAVMVHEESSFDPVHRTARILGASEGTGEVRLAIEGRWKIGAAPEEDLLDTWEADARPPLDDVLDGIQKNFSSAKVGNLVAEIRRTLSGASPAA